jgi:hypothetical protein
LDASSPDQLSEVFDYDGGTGQEEIAALLTFAKNRDLELSKRKAADSIAWVICSMANCLNGRFCCSTPCKSTVGQSYSSAWKN